MFQKVRFRKGFKSTAGLILDADELAAMTMTEISRLFPMWEAPKMHWLEVSPEFETFEDAFEFEFKEPRTRFS